MQIIEIYVHLFGSRQTVHLSNLPQTFNTAPGKRSDKALTPALEKHYAEPEKIL
jgi:hypothetical protein